MRLATATIGLFAALVGLPALAQKPLTVGEYQAVSLESPHPYGALGLEPLSGDITIPGATYVRVHFSQFQLAPGDWLTLSSPTGESFRYEGRGPHGSGEFWANTILGSTAIVSLHAPTGGAFGFTIDGIGRGTVPLDGSDAAPKSVCGTQDWKDVKCYESSRPTEFERAKGAVLALIGCCSSCTAFKVSDNGQFMTNNHCTSSNSGVQSTELRFNYQLPGCASGTGAHSGSVFGSSLLKTDATLDYTLFTTSGDASSIPCLQLDNRLPPVGERIYIAGHPSGGVKKLSIDSDQNSGGLCRVDRSPYAGNAADTDVGYYCDTTNGSSGSPVLSGDTNKVVALHHFGGCLNSGARMDRIVPQISGLLASCNGGSGGPVCGNNSCEAGETSCNCASDCGAPPASEIANSTCGDQKDNDCDTRTDCADGDCATDPLCSGGGCKPAGATCTFNTDCCSRRCLGTITRRTCR